MSYYSGPYRYDGIPYSCLEFVAKNYNTPISELTKEQIIEAFWMSAETDRYYESDGCPGEY
jgi:hypothetical protein